MPSSIFSFKDGASSRSVRDGLLGFTISFTLALFAGFWFCPGPDRAWRGDTPGIPSGGIVLNEVDSDHFDIYDYLYYGIDGILQNVKKADIILLGNSRVLFAFRSAKVEEALKGSGVKIFNLCFPANDGLVMARETILRHDLRPAVVVVNVDKFFTLARSPYGKETIGEGAWQSRIRIWEHRMSWSARLWIHRVFPRINIGKIYSAEPIIACQSLSSGCLVFENISAGREPAPIRAADSDENYSQEELRLAIRFKKEMGERGTNLVLMSIPYDMESYLKTRKRGSGRDAFLLSPENLKPPHKADKLAQALGVPLIIPEVGDLQSIDGSHLTEESANRFAGEFFKKLFKLYSPGKKLGKVENHE